MRENIFFALNPWRVGGDIPLPSNNVMRDAAEEVFRSVNIASIKLLIGTRRTGKTTIFYQLISLLMEDKGVKPENIFYFTFDDIDLRKELTETSDAIIDIIEKFLGTSFNKTKGKLYIFIDEVQKFPPFFERLKLYHDTYRSKFSFFISGSSSLELSARSAETLAGRVDYTKVEPFSLKEIVRSKFPNIRPLSFFKSIVTGDYTEEIAMSYQATFLPYLTEIREFYETAMVWGWLPEVHLAQDNEARLNFLGNYRATYLEKDITGFAQIGSAEEYSRVLDIVISQLSNILDITRISRETGLSINTVRKYINILVQTFVLKKISPYTGSIRKRLVRRPKIYLFDNGPYTFLTQLENLEQLRSIGKIGALFENYCLNEINKSILSLPASPDIHFWRTSTGLEVDFVAEHKGYLMPIEVKYKKTIDEQDLKSFYKFREIFKDRIKKAVVIYNGDFKEQDEIIYLPVWMI